MEFHHATIFEAIADELPDAPALSNGDHKVTYAQLDDRASRLAGALAAAGLGPQARVAIDLYNSNEWMEAYYGSVKGRFVPVSINYRYLDDELSHLLENSDSEAIIFHASLGERVVPVAKRIPNMKLIIQVDDIGGAEVPDGVVDYHSIVTEQPPADRIERSPDDIVMWYSGGTTGLPKGILLPIGRSVEMYSSPEGRLRTLGRFTDPPESINADIVAAARGVVGRGRSTDRTAGCALDAQHSDLVRRSGDPGVRRHDHHAGRSQVRRTRVVQRGRPRQGDHDHDRR